MKKITIVALLLLLASCDSEKNIYSLYRNSPFEEAAKVHVATFDAKDNADYNKTNCLIAKDLFQNQEGVVTTFWCEKGRYKASNTSTGLTNKVRNFFHK